MQINRAPFFANIRRVPFNGSLSQTQVDGINAVLDEWEKRQLTDTRWLAYMLATDFWETARTMQAIREYGRGRGKEYGRPTSTGHAYYGRGLVQLTWERNYRVMGGKLGVDLVNNPDLALDLNIAVQVMFDGMMLGLFTGKRLSQYFNGKTEDWVNARRIINGTDKAQTIARIAKQFHEAIVDAGVVEAAAPKPTKPSKTGTAVSTGAAGTLVSVLGYLADLPWGYIAAGVGAVVVVGFVVGVIRDIRADKAKDK